MATPHEIKWRQLMRIGGGGDENTQPVRVHRNDLLDRPASTQGLGWRHVQLGGLEDQAVQTALAGRLRVVANLVLINGRHLDDGRRRRPGALRTPRAC